jgi:phage tail sheath protein FI
MPVTPSYPGLYFEELPSSTHTITPAPTSITVFVGYTHPFKTQKANAGKAVRLFSFNDYERAFGGFILSGLFDGFMPHAVNQFFLNGGSDAYIVGLAPRYRDSTGAILNPQQVLDPDDSNHNPGSAAMNPQALFASADNQPGIQFYGLEPIDSVPMRVEFISKPAPDGTADARADLTITYGVSAETFRDLTLTANDPTHIASRINGASALVRVRPNPNTSSYPANFNTANLGGLSKLLTGPPPPTLANINSTFSPSDYTAVFQSDTDLDNVPIFNLMVLPGVADNGIWSTALAFCERKMAFLILDPPRQANAYFTEDNTSAGTPLVNNVVPKSTNGAIYFPYIFSQDPLTGDRIELPPSGFVAGVYARTDTNRGVWKTPAGIEANVLSTTGVVDRGRMNDPRQGVLNLQAVNCLRSFPAVGTVVYGGRTLVGAKANTAFAQWRYIAVRRMALFIEQTLRDNLTWVVFEPNDEPLWTSIRTTIDNFLLSLFRQGALQGSTPSQAFQVKCDSTTTTPDDVNNGIVNILVAFAPLKPAEFVIIKIAQLAGQTQA